MTDRAYSVAFEQATETANRLNMDVGLQRDALGGWSVFVLPRVENRRGEELRCQVVSPSPSGGSGPTNNHWGSWYGTRKVAPVA